MEHLKSPISDESNCGEYLKGNRTVYRALRNQFNMAQSSFRQLLETPDATSDEELIEQNATNWRELASQCDETLSSTSKDLEVFGWFITAQMFSANPMANTAVAIDVFTEVVKAFWNDLQPTLPDNKIKAEDEAGRLKEIVEFRVKPLLQLVGEAEGSGLLYMPLQLQSLIGDIDYTRYAQAERNGQLGELKAEAAKSIAGEKEAVIEIVNALGEMHEKLIEAETFIASECQKAGTQGVSFRFIKKNIESVISAIKYLVGDYLKPWPLDKAQPAEESAQEASEQPTESSESAPSTVVASSEAVVNVVASGAILNRDHAFNELRKIADYFYKTEPHSPIYMLIERAIRWGYLPLPELLKELVGENDNVMGRITHLAGLESTEKMAIPAVEVSMGDIAAAQSQPSAAPTPPPAPAAVAMPASSPETTSSNSGTTDSSNSDSDGSISNFEW